MERGGIEPLLTRQQRRALHLVALGCTDDAIAQRLGLSPRTVRFHVAAAVKQLHALSRPHAVALAIYRGEIRAPAH
jgi:DNA-binding CsgD family transcriptional regulator